MPGALEGKTALVTGASKGIGKGIALELARAGCDVAVNYNSDRKGAEATVSEIRGLGRQAYGIQANVGRRADVETLFAELRRRFSRLDILVNNAGTQVFKPLLELNEEEWDRRYRRWSPAPGAGCRRRRRLLPWDAGADGRRAHSPPVRRWK